MEKSIRAEAKIERAALSVGCTPQGIAWLEAALDPFPDEDRSIAGYPDMITSKSVVQAFRQKMTVSSTAGVVWDANIFHDGLFQGTTVVTQTVSENATAQTGQGVTGYSVGGIVTRAAVTNAPTYITGGSPTLQLDPVFGDDIPYRVIAMGMEIQNTTASIAKQGNVVYWRQSAPDFAVGIQNVGTTVLLANNAMSRVSYVNPPETAADALQLQGSRSFKAEDGAYIVGTLATPALGVHRHAGPERYVWLGVTSNAVNYGTAINNIGTQYFCNTKVVPSGFNQFGAYFTGLSPTTTLDVVWHYIVERFPRATDLDLITMSSSSSPFDPKALELYTKTSWHLPAGVPVDENGLGDWLATVADTLGSFGVPGMGLAKGVIRGVQAISNSFDNSARPVQSPVSIQTTTAPISLSEEKRIKMNAKAKAKKKAPKQGPLMPNAKFNSNKKIRAPRGG